MRASARVSFLIFASRWKRTVSFVCALALLSWTAGLLGNYFMTHDQSVEPAVVLLVNQDDSPMAGLLMNSLEPAIQDTKVLKVRLTDLADAEQQMKQDAIAAYYVIPPDFMESVFAGENKPVQAVYNPYKPLQASLIELFVNEALAVLQNSQTGIYATLDYVRNNAPERYDELFREVNGRYMNTALKYDQMVRPQVISPIGEIGVFGHYLLAAIVFLLMLGCMLFIPMIREAFSAPVLVALRRQRVASVKITSGWTLGWWLWYSIVGALLIGGYAFGSNVLGLPFSPWMFPAMAVLMLFLASLGVMLGFVFPRTDAVVILVLYSALSLLFSGGILPLMYLAEPLRRLAVFFPAYWGVQLLEQAASGIFAPIPCLLLLLFSGCAITVSALLIARRQRGGIA